MMLVIQITSDTICPFCYVGKRRLESALTVVKKAHPSLPIVVEWKPFMLDPTLPKEGVNKIKNYEKKFGPSRLPSILNQMDRTGLKDNIKFSWKGMVANTLDSHRLIEYAEKQAGEEGQDKMVEALFKAYFEEEKNIGDHETLATIAEKACEFDKAVVLSFLESNELVENIQKKIRAVPGHVHGVPYFDICYRKEEGGEPKKITAISGAQDVGTFVSVLEEAIAEIRENN